MFRIFHSDVEQMNDICNVVDYKNINETCLSCGNEDMVSVSFLKGQSII